MGKIYNTFLMVIACSFLFSCKKKVDITINTLSKSGEEFYFGERVPVWAGTSGDKHDISYEWQATGGSFDGWRTQNLFENLWIAPNEVGEYTVTATAKSGGSSSSRSTVMKVTRYFFDEFQSIYTLNGNGWVTGNAGAVLKDDVDPKLSSLELTATSSSGPYIRRDLNLAELKIPFSVRTELGWKDFYRSGSPITFKLMFKQPSDDPSNPYIREIRCEVWPVVESSATSNYQIRYETFVPATNFSKFSVSNGVAPNPQPLVVPIKGIYPPLAMNDGEIKSFSFSIDAENVFHAYVDGELWFTSNGIKDWLAYAKDNFPGSENPVFSQFQVSFPAKSGNTGTTLVMKSVYINNNGEILK